MLPRATQHAHVARAVADRRAHAGDSAPHRTQHSRDARRFPFGEFTIKLDCDVLSADGGTRTASITGACVAVVDAFDWLVRDRRIADVAGEASRRGGECRRHRRRRRGSISTTRKMCAPTST